MTRFLENLVRKKKKKPHTVLLADSASNQHFTNLPCLLIMPFPTAEPVMHIYAGLTPTGNLSITVSAEKAFP